MKKCKYCMSEIDEKAIICPVCKMKQNKKGNINLIVIIVVILFIVIISFMFIKDRNETIDNLDKISTNNK